MLWSIAPRPRLFPSQVALGAQLVFRPKDVPTTTWLLSFPSPLSIDAEASSDLVLWTDTGRWDVAERFEQDGSGNLLYYRAEGLVADPDGYVTHNADDDVVTVQVGDRVTLGGGLFTLLSAGQAPEPDFAGVEWDADTLRQANASRAWALQEGLPEEAYHHLVQAPDRVTLERLARNSGLPADLYPFFAEFYPNELADNPGLPMYLLIDPDLSRLSPARRSMIRRLAHVG
ncbi:MAG: hypothetical protein IT477_10375 [Rhodanobacteraceae bacterium]|nr:hypothetical protein [Rhodanobacteraceae bacterium]